MPCSNGRLMPALKYLRNSFETIREFLAVAIAKELKKMKLQQLFVTTDEKKHFIESLSVRKELQFKLI